MKKKEPKVIDRFVASNGMIIEVAPEKEAARPLTAKELKLAKPVSRKKAGITPDFIAAFKEMAEKRGRGRPKVAHPKKLISFRLDSEIVSHLKHDVARYNSRVEQVLRDAIAEGRI